MNEQKKQLDHLTEVIATAARRRHSELWEYGWPASHPAQGETATVEPMRRRKGADGQPPGPWMPIGKNHREAGQ